MRPGLFGVGRGQQGVSIAGMPKVATVDTVSRDELLDFLRPRTRGSTWPRAVTGGHSFPR